MADLRFYNVRFKHEVKSNKDNYILDLDGCLGGKPGDVVAFLDSYSLADSDCQNSTSKQFINGILCSNTKSWIRLGIYLWGYHGWNQNAINIYNTKNNKNRTTSFKGNFWYNWNYFALEANQEYQLLHRYNELYFYFNRWEMKPGEFIILTIQLQNNPYRVYLGWYYRLVKNNYLNSSNKTSQ